MQNLNESLNGGQNSAERSESAASIRQAGRISRKERSNQRRQMQSENTSRSPHLNNFTKTRLSATDTSQDIINQSAKLMQQQYNEQPRIRSTQLHLKQTVSSMHKKVESKKKPSSSQLSRKSSGSNPGNSQRFGQTSSYHKTSRSRDLRQVSSQESLKILNSRERSYQSINSKTERVVVQNTSPLTPLLDNLILQRSKQSSQDSKTLINSFTEGTKNKNAQQSKFSIQLSSSL